MSWQYSFWQSKPSCSLFLFDSNLEGILDVVMWFLRPPANSLSFMSEPEDPKMEFFVCFGCLKWPLPMRPLPLSILFCRMDMKSIGEARFDWSWQSRRAPANSACCLS